MAALRLHQDPDLASIGITSQLIPYILVVESGVEQPTNDPNIPPTSADVQDTVEKLDKAFSSPTTEGLKERCVVILCNFSRLHGVRPKSCSPSGVILKEPHGRPAGPVEVWKGEHGGNQVCVKTFRIPESPALDEIRQSFYREIVRWKYISHSNVLPFFGVLEESPGLRGFCIINPWLENGNILEYIGNNPGVNRFQLLAQATCGLIHLHSLDIVHGGINPGNVLITEEGSVRLADFGIAAILTGSAAVRSGSMAVSKHGTARYKAPELLGDNPAPLKESDVYSLGMISFEVLSGVPPYDKKPGPLVAYSIVNHEWPTRPKNETVDRWLSDPIWDAIQDCWAGNPQSRLPLDSLHQKFVGLGPGQQDNITETGKGVNGQERVVRQQTDTDPPSNNPRPSKVTNDTPSNPSPSSNQPARSSGGNGHTSDNLQVKGRIDRTSGNRQPPLNQPANSSDRTSSTSKKTGLLKRAMNFIRKIWEKI